jgi:hypothetical protein
VSSLRRGHANLLCIVPILSYETGFTLLDTPVLSVGLEECGEYHDRGCSSHGRAPALHAGGTGIDTLLLHVFFLVMGCRKKTPKIIANPSFDLGTFRL